MPTSVEISNLALQKLGAKRITSLTENSVNARACNVAFTLLHNVELRKHRWNFAIVRAQIAADATEPEWGRANSFTLPGDCLKVIPPYPEDDFNSRDWIIEAGKILTDDSAPLYVRYISSDAVITDVTYAEALACKMADHMCEEITQSNTKKVSLEAQYKDAIKEARKANAFEVVPQGSPEDSWVTCRE